ncbi:MAG: hypothetical protein PVH65_13535 [Chloroflexota bacterium]|jgi:hypothetical protein
MKALINGRSAVTVVAVAVLLVLLALAAGWVIARGDDSLLRNVSVDHETITPNADGQDDATTIRYELARNANVSITFADEAGRTYYFRQARPRGVGEYQVLFSGVVDGYDLPGETIQGEILARLLQDGRYTWTISAVEEDGHQESASGSLVIADADTQLPELRNFSLDKSTFTPNQDGIDDRVSIQFFLPKEATQTRVFLVTPEGAELPVAELERGVAPGSVGRHYFDYEAGVDNKATPPPDGTYPVFAMAEDAEGQKVQVEDSLTIQYGGVPRAEIISPAIGDTVEFNTTAVVLCDTLSFTLTVQNYGTTPIRTTGPAPGTTYDSDWNYNTLGWHTESGAWRVAIGYENEISNYPYRWSVGSRDELEKIGDHWYLMPGERAVITGSIRLVGPFGERNPQPVWAGLIHEDVEISEFNNRVDPHEILVDIADVENPAQCQPREIPAG